jgi:hypothetical protein
MQKEIAACVARCDTCCRVKAVHMKAGLLQPLSIPGWKWEEISMDFIVGLPPTIKNHNSIWVIVDRLTKLAHFIPIRVDYHPTDYAELYFNQIVWLHGIPRAIVSDRGLQFTARFWEHLHDLLGTKLVRSSAYHPQTSGQTSWEKWLSLAEFSYNNSYQESIKMAPFEALYGRKCRTPLN